MKAEKYRICIDNDARGLERQVNELLKEGWELGAQPMIPIVRHYWSGWTFILKSVVSYSQALIKTQGLEARNGPPLP